jgi:hypothetical protein
MKNGGGERAKSDVAKKKTHPVKVLTPHEPVQQVRTGTELQTPMAVMMEQSVEL